MSFFINYYQLLGIQQNASLEEIKKAYREKVKEFHPDKGGRTEEFILIKEAYDILSNVRQREDYDKKYLLYQQLFTKTKTTESNTTNDSNFDTSTSNPNYQQKTSNTGQFNTLQKSKAIRTFIGLGIALVVLSIVIGFFQQSPNQTVSSKLQTESPHASVSAFPTGNVSTITPTPFPTPTNTLNASSSIALNVTTPEPSLNNQTPVATAPKQEQPTQTDNINPVRPKMDISTFYLGSTVEQVKKSMGAPDSVSDIGPISTWHYGRSTVSFNNNRVDGYKNGGNLNLEQTSLTNDTFTLSSNSDQVQKAMGIPDSIMTIGPLATWHYGNSFVNFNNSIVDGYDNRQQNLKIENKSANGGSISIGFTKEQVKTTMGTPDSIRTIGPLTTWYYGRSTISFKGNVVDGYNNAGANLNIK